jgi:hypothetical protein
MKKLRCIICGNKISDYRAKRCRKCYTKTLIGKTNPSYKHGGKHKNQYCKCGKLIDFRSKRCRSCAIKRAYRLGKLNHKGKNHPMYGRKFTKPLYHHINLNQSNNRKTNLLLITPSKHQILHRKSYEYLVKIRKVKHYIRWFIKHYGVE